MDRPRKLTYSNVISTLCLFLLLGGGTAFAASHLGKNSVGTAQLKKNAVTAAKLKAGAVTGAKIAAGAITADKLAPGVTSTEKVVGAPSAGPAPASGPSVADVVKGPHGTLQLGQEAPVFSYGPFTITARCREGELSLAPNSFVEEQFLISSSTPHSVFASNIESGADLGPDTPALDRVVGANFNIGKTDDTYLGQGPGLNSVSASAVGGQAFNAFIGQADDEVSGTCFYWLSATIIS